MAVIVNDSNFEEIVMKSDKPVVLDFWAEWCGPCRMITPIIEEMANEYEGRAVIAKVNVDESNGVAVKYGVRNIPTVIFIKGGNIVDKQVGAAPKATFTAKLDAIL
ncbi:MAG: thioredoxin [Prevotellaceae bacterium]|jgi:thioredoxin 1|nr:thioredoxin [Prevotellaceae bacterium]